MRRALAVLFLVGVTAGCTSWQSGVNDVNLSGEDILYLKDERTDLCFAVLVLGNKMGTSVSQMAMTNVDCSALGNVPAR